jgi:hypothetical protein
MRKEPRLSQPQRAISRVKARGEPLALIAALAFFLNKLDLTRLLVLQGQRVDFCPTEVAEDKRVVVG